MSEDINERGEDTNERSEGQNAADEPAEAAIPPEQAFGVLGDETRVAIVRALAAARNEPLGFSELRSRVGFADSGGFNYHLGKLVGRFVRKDDDGYVLTTAGHQIYGAIVSGTYTDSVDLDPIPLDGDEDVCPDCGAPLEATYADERMQVACSECDRVVAASALPPAAVEGRDPETLPAAFGHYLTAMVELARAGFCSLCSGVMTGHLTMEAVEAFEADEDLPLAVYECDRCINTVHMSPGTVLTTHPAVVSFYHDRGVDVRDVPPWRLPLHQPSAHAVVAEDPLEVAVTVEADGDVLTVTLDASLAVLDVERTER